MNKKGFTLIELLAVIVILAVIALIATPVVMNSINNARQGAAENAGYGVIKAVEHNIAVDILNGNNPTMSGTVTAVPGNLQGTAPSDMSLTLTDGAVTGGTMCINSYGLTVNSTGRVTATGSSC